MRWLMAQASLRTRWLVTAAWAFVWAVGYGAATLIPYGVSGFRWWVPIVGFSLGMALVTGAVVAWSERGVAASYAAVLEGLTTKQRRQIAQVWRPGAVPSDPAVLTAALRLHDLAERYRLGKRRRRTVGAVLVCIATVMLVATVVSARHTFSASTLMFLLVGAMLVAGPTLAALRATRRRPRLAQLRAAAAADPSVAAAVANPATPAAPLSRTQRRWWAVATVTLALVYVGALEIAMSVAQR